MRSESNLSLTFLALSLVLLTPSCLLGSKNHTETTGSYISSETFDRVEIGQDEAFVANLMGPPDSKITSEGDDGESTIWKWSYSSETKSSGSVFLIISTSTTSNSTGSTFVEFREHKVVKAWRD